MNFELVVNRLDKSAQGIVGKAGRPVKSLIAELPHPHLPKESLTWNVWSAEGSGTLGDAVEREPMTLKDFILRVVFASFRVALDDFDASSCLSSMGEAMSSSARGAAWKSENERKRKRVENFALRHMNGKLRMIRLLTYPASPIHTIPSI